MMGNTESIYEAILITNFNMCKYAVVSVKV